MDNIEIIPDIPIIKFVDAILLKTDQFNEDPVKLSDIDTQLKIAQIDINLKDVVRTAKLGEQLTLRGILDIKENTIYLDSEEEKLYRKRFSHAHEIGHYFLPKHREILYRCSKEDMLPSSYSRIECEANQFAAHLLFKGTIFSKVISDMSHPTFDDIQTNADKYNVSYTSTARKIVEDNPNPVGLLFIDFDGMTPKLSYSITSKEFRTKYFKYVNAMSDLDEIYQECQGRDFSNPFIKPYKVSLPSGSIVDIEIQFFYNQYQIMGLMTPIK